MITIHQLTHHYGLRPVLMDVSCDIEKGDLVVLLGPNGSGKTTLLGCMAGTIWPARGHVAFDGVKRRKSEDGERELRKKIVYLPDDTWLPKAHTGREFILAVGRLYDVDDFRLFDHADRLIKLFHLDEQEDAAIASYSTGQRKKVALASALITEAPFLLLDEPFSGGLDPAGILAFVLPQSELEFPWLCVSIMRTRGEFDEREQFQQARASSFQRPTEDSDRQIAPSRRPVGSGPVRSVWHPADAVLPVAEAAV